MKFMVNIVDNKMESEIAADHIEVQACMAEIGDKIFKNFSFPETLIVSLAIGLSYRNDDSYDLNRAIEILKKATELVEKRRYDESVENRQSDFN